MTQPSLKLASATDNDIVLKAVCYGVAAAFWPNLGSTRHLGVLGAARYIIGDRIDRAALRGDKIQVHARFTALLGFADVLEPTIDEIELAAEMETAAAQAGVSLDSGESQLAAMVCHREIEVLETGDKRAIVGLETVLDQVPGLLPICGRVRSLEQIVRAVAANKEALRPVARAVCAEPEIDIALSVCFSCYSSPAGTSDPAEGLDSYIADLRRNARRILIA
jgi:hypothetical protein